MKSDVHKEEVMESLKGMDIPWKRSKDDVWASLEVAVNKEAPVRKGRTISLIVRYAAAAVLLLALAGGTFMRLYQKEYVSSNGEFLTHELPDGSVVEMNAGSSLAYHPYWFSISRTLHFEGEGFFSVEKGKKFTVESASGNTRVLGTSFSIFARDDQYAVTCHTGKVGVTIPAGDSVLLTPFESAHFKPEQGLVKERINKLPDPASWKNGLYSFTAADLKDVLKEIERYYNIRIKWDQPAPLSYSGDLDFNQGAEKTLRLVCTPFTLTFEKISEGEFKVVRKK